MAGFQNLRVTRTVDFTGATVVGYPSGLMGKGRVFYVDNTLGADGYGVQSQNPNYPMLTISGAMDLCTSGVGDVVCVMQNSPSTGTTGETWPIAMDVQGVLLTGLYSRGLLSDSGFGSATLNGDTITPTANYCNVENLYLGVKIGGTTGNVIAGTTSCFAFTLRNCMLEAQYTALYCFYTGASADFPYLLIEDNIFGGTATSHNTSAIKLFNATRGMIRRNVFLSSTSYAIDINATCGNVCILNNTFTAYTDIDGFAVYLRTGSSDITVSGNVGCHGKDSPANDPFWVQANDDSSHSGINYEGIDATDLLGA